ncbi:extracellular solute-binding protein [Phycisphaerales bacterium AB-hyl4]|uniref:Extracellular solute-binding protein n=1 Tax=Natronomicrosphaera hydrolytica TaxID=3242702 RepID=A0ABV4U3D3_9BACT
MVNSVNTCGRRDTSDWFAARGEWRIVVFALLTWLAIAAASNLAAGSPVDADASEQELVVWVAWRDRGLEAAFRQFERQHPGVRIVVSLGAGPSGMDPQKLMTGIAGGSPPDVLIQDRFTVGEWASRNAFEPLDEFVERSRSREAAADAALEAVEAGDGEAVSRALDEVMGSLEPVGRGPTLRAAERLNAALERGTALNDLVDEARELARLSQGIDSEAYYHATWAEASVGEGADRRVYAIPLSTDVRVLYYNEDLLEREGLVDEHGRARPPRDWDELRDYANRLTEYDAAGRMTRLGFAPNYGNSWLYIYGWLNEGEFMTPDGREATLADPRIVEALHFMRDIYDDLGGVEAVDAFQSTFQGGELDPFLSDRVAMKIDGNWFLNDIADYAPGLRFSVAPPPAPAGNESITWSGGFSWAIPRGSPDPELAFELVRFLMTDRSWEHQHQVRAQFAASRGRSYVPEIAPRADVNEMLIDRFVEGNPDLPRRIQDAFRLSTEVMEISRFRPVTPVGQLLWDEHVRAYERAVRHTLSPEDALQRGQQRVQRQLDRIHADHDDPPVPWGWVMVGGVALGLAGMAGLYWHMWRRDRLREVFREETLWGVLFASPFLLGLVFLTGGPILVSLIYSLSRYDVLHPAEFVGLENYRQLLFEDSLFWYSLANTGFMLLGLPLTMAIGLGVAMLLNMNVKGMAVYRTIFYLPAIVPAVASAILWIWVLNPEIGLVNSFLRMIGIRDLPLWLHSSAWLTGSKSAIIVMGLWGAGASMIIWLAGLKGIPQHLYEAAEIDGAGPWHKFWAVTMPMLSPYIFFNLIMGTIATLQIFTPAYIMTQGGPDDSTLFFAYYLFNKAFRYFEMGYASAMAWILFVLTLALTIIQMKLAHRWVHYEAP